MPIQGTPFSDILGAYASRSDVEDIFGTAAVAAYADKDGDKDATKIASRVNRALIVATATIQTTLRGGVYGAAPQFNSGTPDVLIVDACAKLAGLWLYRSFDTEGDEFADFRSQAVKLQQTYKRIYGDTMDFLRSVRGGLIQIDAKRVTAGDPVRNAPSPTINGLSSEFFCSMWSW